MASELRRHPEMLLTIAMLQVMSRKAHRSCHRKDELAALLENHDPLSPLITFKLFEAVAVDDEGFSNCMNTAAGLYHACGELDTHEHCIVHTRVSITYHLGDTVKPWAVPLEALHEGVVLGIPNAFSHGTTEEVAFELISFIGEGVDSEYLPANKLDCTVEDSLQPPIDSGDRQEVVLSEDKVSVRWPRRRVAVFIVVGDVDRGRNRGRLCLLAGFLLRQRPQR